MQYMTLYGQHQYFLKKKQIIYGCETNSLYYILDLFDKIGFFNIDRIAIDSFDIYILWQIHRLHVICQSNIGKIKDLFINLPNMNHDIPLSHDKLPYDRPIDNYILYALHESTRVSRPRHDSGL